MLMTEIRKESIGMVEQINGGLASLAESAMSVLGYDVLAKITGKVSLEEMTPIQAALQELEIEVLNRRDVFVYQRERMIERTVELCKEWLREQPSRETFDRLDRFSGPSWIFHKISEYKQPIPEFVLAKAVQIKQRVPECEIYVVALEDYPDPFLVIGGKQKYSWQEPDEAHYVEVWAEPKFEGRINTEEIPF
jgi:hypothetical protein